MQGPAKRVAGLVVVALILVMVTPGAAYAGDGPVGFWWGTDEGGPTPGTNASMCSSASTPWLEPNVANHGCGHYGFYGGNVDAYYSLLGCPFTSYWNAVAATRSRSTSAYYSGAPVGTVAYYFGGGPGADPNYNGSTAEARAWGKKQADAAIRAAGHHTLSHRLIVLDVEDSGGTDGWNEIVRPCGTITKSGVAPQLDRATFNGFWDEIEHHSSYRIGVYSTAYIWSGIFGTGAYASLTRTMEITADWGGNCANPAPRGWTQPGGSCATNTATFFGGIDTTSPCALGWQWSGGARDYDQIDSKRLFVCH